MNSLRQIESVKASGFFLVIAIVNAWWNVQSQAPEVIIGCMLRFAGTVLCAV